MNRNAPTAADPTAGDWFLLDGRAATAALGRRLGVLLRAGDVLLLTGDLGAGKTTLTQSIAEGLGVRGPITSPTFVIARVHPNLLDGPALVHVDAYRLGDHAELDDLDLDSELADSVVVIEWGRGLAEELQPEYLELELARDLGEHGEEQRRARMTGHGTRWRGVPLPRP